MFNRWNASLETGQMLMDLEHRLLFLLFRRLDVAVKTGHPRAAVNHIVNEVIRFVEFHFVSEENIMRETGYPELLEHQALHAELLATLRVHASKVVGHSELPADLLAFINRWQVEHIAYHDQHMALYVRDSANRPVAEDTYGEYLLPRATTAA